MPSQNLLRIPFKCLFFKCRLSQVYVSRICFGFHTPSWTILFTLISQNISFVQMILKPTSLTWPSHFPCKVLLNASTEKFSHHLKQSSLCSAQTELPISPNKPGSHPVIPPCSLLSIIISSEFQNLSSRIM